MSIEDEIQIRNLVAKLALHADDNDIDGYLALLTEDAEWHMDLPHWQSKAAGHAQLKAAALQRRAEGIQGAGLHKRHLVTTHAIDVKGEVATGRCYMLAMREANKQPPLLDVMVVYDDEYRKTKSGWKLARRRITEG